MATPPGAAALAQVGYWRLSNITDIEDLTYVSSPYIPACIQNGLHVQDMPRSNHQIAAKVPLPLPGRDTP